MDRAACKQWGDGVKHEETKTDSDGGGGCTRGVS